MKTAESLTTFQKAASAEFTEKKSVFIGYASPVKSVGEAEEFLAGIRKKHADARHAVFAYIVGASVRCSDDGEPKGTGGVPVLEVLKKSGVDGAVLVVVRYFGGILLGAPGLVRAYSKAAAMAAEAAGIVTYQSYTECELRFAYAFYDRLLYEIGRRNILIDQTDFGTEITMRLAVRSAEYADFEAALDSLSNGRIRPVCSGCRFDAPR